MGANSQQPVVELRSVSKMFDGQVKAVDAVNLVVNTGETVALLGTSGCGKTTTLRLINRLTESDSGEVLVRGRLVTRQRPEVLRRSIGYVIQEGGLLPHLSVADNVATVPRLLRWPAASVRRRTAEVLELVGLPPDDFGPRRPAALSGGQRQRVGVARALSGDPDLLLMDEPFGALDPVTRESLRDEFFKLQARLRKTVILVTHDMVEAGKLADRIVLMDRGRIVQEGTLGDLLLRPAGEFVRSFFALHRQQLAFEALRLDDILDEAEPVATAGSAKVISPAGTAVVHSVLNALVHLDADSIVSPSDGRHTSELFSIQAVRRRLFDDLVS